MRKHLKRTILLTSLLFSGCGFQHGYAPDTGHHDLWDAAFRRRHLDPKHPVHCDDMLSVAREITVLEDDIRRDGSITIKTPDVWGDGNLMASIQEYERVMKTGLDTKFKETVQAYIARSDQAELSSSTALASGLGSATAPSSKAEASVIDITQPGLFSLLENATKGAPLAAEKKGIGLEPTELERQLSTFLHVNQALRRRMIGDDNSRAAGYGLYKFRVPVSVLPGRETTQGHTAVVNLRAQLQVDQTHLKNTFPKMVIADLVESLTPRILSQWAEAAKELKTLEQSIDSPLKPRSQAQAKNITRHAEDAASPNKIATFPNGVATTSQNDIYGENEILELSKLAVFNFTLSPANLDNPKPQDVKDYLHSLFSQTHNVMYENQIYHLYGPEIDVVSQFITKGQYSEVKKRQSSCTSDCCKWQESLNKSGIADDHRLASWFIAIQSGILDRNLKKILEDLARNGKLPANQQGMCEAVFFYQPENPEAVRLWETIIRENFPLHVFALDPQVEEQNAYDAFSRRRELQLALAYSVAKGSVFTADQKLKMSRALSLDEATIALNRTAVAFSHGDDTFGWYFYPRVQTPPVESTNIGALARCIWSTGPTEHYDLKHRKLEPGIRECEVLIAMPSFVNQVSFDVTTNWEKMARPGVTKRSYEEMVAQGGRLHRLRMCMQDPKNQNCYRPGDYARLLSRIEQLEEMLGLQTYTVNLPYEYEQTGSGLFDTGKKQQRPVIDFYYGLTFLQPQDDKTNPEAEFFITGKNFHPTLTHVIVGGVESHLSVEGSVDSDVEVINRELIRVRVKGINEKLSENSKFEVRVGTPAGMSNTFVITKQAEKPTPKAPEKSIYDFPGTVSLTGSTCICEGKDGCAQTTFCLQDEAKGQIRIVLKSGHPFMLTDGNIKFNVKRTRKVVDKTEEVELGTTSQVPMRNLMVNLHDLQLALSPLVNHRTDYKADDVLICTGILNFNGTAQGDVPMTSPIEIKLQHACAPLPKTTAPEEALPTPATKPSQNTETNPSKASFHFGNETSTR